MCHSFPRRGGKKFLKAVNAFVCKHRVQIYHHCGCAELGEVFSHKTVEQVISTPRQLLCSRKVFPRWGWTLAAVSEQTAKQFFLNAKFIQQFHVFWDHPMDKSVLAPGSLPVKSGCRKAARCKGERGCLSYSVRWWWEGKNAGAKRPEGMQ